MNDFKPLAYLIAQKHNVIGGLCIGHPFRKDRYDKLWTHEMTVHFHIIGYALGDLGRGGSDHDKQGRMIVFKVIVDKEYGDYRGFRSERGVKRECQYLLTHCGILEGEHSLTWFGMMAYNRMTKTKIDALFPGALTETVPKAQCPVCGSRDTESCVQMDFTDRRRCSVGVHEEPDHPPDEIGLHEAIWLWLRKTLREEPSHAVDRDCLIDCCGDPEVSKVIDWNIKTGRLNGDGRIVQLTPWVPTMDYALGCLKKMTIHGKKPGRGDPQLEKIAQNAGYHPQLNDTDYIFNSLRVRYEQGRVA
jgi:hypothetical protein